MPIFLFMALLPEISKSSNGHLPYLYVAAIRSDLFHYAPAYFKRKPAFRTLTYKLVAAVL